MANFVTRETLPVIIQFETPLLGTVPDPEVYSKYIQDKARELSQSDKDAELETVQDVEEKGWTRFHRDEKGLFIYSYMVKGFLKSALESLMATGTIAKIPAYKKWMDKLVFVESRKLYFNVKESDGVIERPLRVTTPQGPRVTLARSDSMNRGFELKFTIVILKNSKKIDMETMKQCLGYGQYVGIGQWRGSGGYGQFTWKEDK